VPPPQIHVDAAPRVAAYQPGRAELGRAASGQLTNGIENEHILLNRNCRDILCADLPEGCHQRVLIFISECHLLSLVCRMQRKCQPDTTRCTATLLVRSVFVFIVRRSLFGMDRHDTAFISRIARTSVVRFSRIRKQWAREADLRVATRVGRVTRGGLHVLGY
jgi:hypothetical protein